MGPVTNVVYQLAKALSAQGHDVTIADCRGPGGPREYFPTDAKLLEMAASSPYPWAGNQTVSKSYRRSLGRAHDAVVSELSAKGAIDAHDVVHVHDPGLAVRLSRVPGTRCFYTCHTPQHWLDPTRYRSCRGAVRALKLRLLEMGGGHDLAAMRAARATVVLHPNFVEALSRLRRHSKWLKRIRVVPNGIDPMNWPEVSRDEARRALAIPEDQFRLVFTGRLHPSKGLHTVLEAVDRLRRDLPDLHLGVIAHTPSDPYATKLYRLAKDLPVTFHGFVRNRDSRFHQLLAASDICVVPSLVDNQPTVVMESLMMGVPVVGSRIGGIPMMVTSDVGDTFEPGNVPALEAIIRRLHDNRPGLDAKRANCRDYVSEEYSWTRAASRYLDTFSEGASSARFGPIIN